MRAPLAEIASLILAAALLTGCNKSISPAPSPSAALSLAPSPEPVVAATCTRGRGEGNPEIVGWDMADLVVAFRGGPCLFDSTKQIWSSIGPRSPGRFATDGLRIAGAIQPDRLVLVSPAGQISQIELPAWATDWSSWGSRLSPLSGGGFVFQLVPDLALVSSDGALADTPLPSGFLLDAPTSNPSTFLLRADDRTTSPQKMQAPHPVYLWKVGDAAPKSIGILVVTSRPSTGPNLAWVQDVTSNWSLLDRSGRVASTAPTTPGWEVEPDPTGAYLVEQFGRSAGCEHDVPQSCKVRLVDSASRAVLTEVNAGSNSDFAWTSGAVAFLPTTPDPASQPSAPGIVELTRDQALLIPMPQAK